MTRSRTALLGPGLTLGLSFGSLAWFAGFSWFAVPAANAAPESGPSFISTNLPAGLPAAPSTVFTGDVSQPLSGSLPGGDSSSGLEETFTVSNPGMLPPGVAIDAGGMVSGIPAADGVYGVSVSACDTDGCTPGVVTFTIGSAAFAVALQNIRLLT